MANSVNVLIVSYQPQLLAPHAEALTAAGFSVTTAGNMSAALGAVGPGGYHVMVLGHTTPAGDRRRVEGEAKRRNSKIKIILMYSGQQERDVFASAFLDIDQPLSEVVECVRSLVS
jgi:DNA-binding response OmpR family regulator